MSGIEHADQRADATAPPRSVRSAAPPLLEARGLSAGYGSLAAVRNVDLVVHAGEVVALLGANGAGKTTTLLALAGALRPLGGETLWCGRRTGSSLFARTRAGMGLVLEERSVFARLTVAENLRIGRGSPDLALTLFPELKPHLKRRVGLLSGGQQQMLAVGRALAARPKALLIDELSLGLAPIVTDRLLEAVRAAASDGVGVLLVEQHVRRALAVSDRGYILSRGQVALHGRSTDLAARATEIEQTYLSVPTEVHN
jgi:ABC-type branched-subunit amino acid transport system ATPase component